MPFPAVINVTELDGSNGFMINGSVPNGYLGSSVSNAGDINGDGMDDIIIGCPGPKTSNSATDKLSGAAYVIFGNNTRFPSQIDTLSLNGVNGFALQSLIIGDYAGDVVAKAGDVNGDGIDDIIIGAIHTNNYIGQAYVIFGSSTGFPPVVYLNNSYLNGANGFIIDGLSTTAFLGASATGIGDINADGIDDIAVGAHALENYTGAAYIIFGNSTSFSATLNVTQLEEQQRGFSITGLGLHTAFGVAICGLGDINGDGIDDLLIGANEASYQDNSLSGAGYVIFGNRDYTTEPPTLPLNGINGFMLNGTGQGALTGASVSAAGDVNGDGIKDILISAPGAPGYKNTSEVYVVFGSRNKFNASISLASLNGTDGFIIPSITTNDYIGNSVSTAGDVNSDGIDDIIIGAPLFPDAEMYGAAYILFGSRESLPANFNLTSLNGANGFTISGLTLISTELGVSVRNAGDINADGIDDVILGAPMAYNNTGTSYVIFGQAPEPTITCSSTFDLTSLDGTNGFIVSNIDVYGVPTRSAIGAGDINGDGFDDIIIGSSNAPDNDGNGIVYILFGGQSFPYLINSTNLDGIPSSIIQSTQSNTYLGYSVSGTGDFNGDGLSDIVMGTVTQSGIVTILFGSPDKFPSRLNLPTSLTGIGIEFYSLNNSVPNGYAALSVDFAGDFNGDGISDVIIGSGSANNEVGLSNVIFGQSSGLQDQLSSADLTGSTGFVINGTNKGDRFGWSVSYAGDINGDSLDDILISSLNNANTCYLVFGQRAEFASPFSISALNGSNGFTISGTDADSDLGYLVSSAGDINGDGFDDILIGAPHANNTNSIYSGAAYVLFGHSGNFSSIIDVASLGGNNGFLINGTESDSLLGYSVSAAGDVNGDGLDDVIIGAPGAWNVTGASYVIYGQRNFSDSYFSVTDLNGLNGYVINGITPGDFFGNSVASANDVNGDGLADVIINHGYPNTTMPGGKIGNVYVIFGSRCNSAVTSSITPSLSVTPSLMPSRTLSPSVSGSITPSSSSSAVPPSNTSTPSLIPSRTLLPSFSPSSSSENSNSLLPLFIAAPIGAFMLLFLVFGLYLHKKRASQNRYGFFNAEGVEPIPEAGEEISLRPSGRQMESYSSINYGNEAELLETYDDNRKSGSKSYCAVM